VVHCNVVLIIKLLPRLIAVLLIILLCIACYNPFMAEILGMNKDKELPQEEVPGGNDPDIPANVPVEPEPEPEPEIPLITWTVTFNSMGGEPASIDQTVADGGKAVRPANPVRDGFGFVNWYEDQEAPEDAYDFDTPVAANITLYALWNEVPPGSFLVKFISDGENIVDDQIILSGGKVEPVDMVKTGCTFDGWYRDENFNTPWNFSDPVTENITLYAKWDINRYTVTFYANDGTSAPVPQIVDYNSNATAISGLTKAAPANQLYLGSPASPTGYTFGGWYTDEDFSGVEWNFNNPVTEDIELYAKWTSSFIDFYTQSGTNDIEKAIAYVNAHAAAGEYTLFVGEDVNLTAITTLETGVLTITSADGARRAISRGTQDIGLFAVRSGAKLVFQNIVIDGKKMSTVNTGDSLVFVDGEFTLGNDAVLKNNSAFNGGGVYVNDDGISPGTFTMSGNAEILDNEANNGGGVYLEGGTFTMTGGLISGNKAEWGGGVSNAGTFAMSGNAKVTKNEASNIGGGVWTTYIFTMEDSAEISDNEADNGGGGVHVMAGGTFTMSGSAKVKDNKAVDEGGGVHTSGNFTMSGNADISGNTANIGGGVWTYGTFTVGGAAKVSGNTVSLNNNVYLSSGKYITLGTGANAPDDGMEIWVQTATAGGVIVNGGVTDAAIAGYFRADETGKDVLQSDDRLVISDFYARVAAYGSAAANVVIEVPYNLTLPRNVTVPQIPSGGFTLTIKSSSGVKTLTRGAADSGTNSGLFIVSNNARLIFENIVIDGDKDIHTSNTMPLVRVNASGTFTLNSGAVLKNNLATNGGGVYIAGGTFNLSGGEISGNTANGGTGGGGGVYVSSGTFYFTSGEVSGNEATSGGGGVYMNGGEFNMSSTTETRISDNSAKRGGGVNVSYATFIMSGGTIGGAGRGNSATDNGGGVYVLTNGTFNMEGGAVSGNKVTGTGGYGGGVYVYGGGKFNMLNSACVIIENQATSNGGGVYVGNANSEFNMRGGSIADNTAARGGGVYAYIGGMFAMTGGEVLDNTATGVATFGGGGGVYLDQGTFRISDGTVYGTDASTGLQNKAESGTGAALGMGEIGTAQYGTLSGTSWTTKGMLDTTNNTIRVLGGELQ